MLLLLRLLYAAAAAATALICYMLLWRYHTVHTIHTFDADACVSIMTCSTHLYSVPVIIMLLLLLLYILLLLLLLLLLYAAAATALICYMLLWRYHKVHTIHTFDADACVSIMRCSAVLVQLVPIFPY